MKTTKLISAIVIVMLLILTIPQTRISAAPATRPTTQPAHKYKITYKLAKGSENWDPAARKRIIDAMDQAVALYNTVGEFDKSITANYSPGTPTADGNYNGWVNFGGSINKRVALHEIAHTLGVGQYRTWNDLMKNGKWTGKFALAQVREFNGPDEILKGDRNHFWPYGLNYDVEGGKENERRHVLLVAALRKDMGIVNGK